MDEYAPTFQVSDLPIPKEPPSSSLGSMDKGEKLFHIQRYPCIHQAPLKGPETSENKGAPGYESTNGIEGAWVFNRKPARECMGLKCIGIPFGGGAPDPRVIKSLSDFMRLRRINITSRKRDLKPACLESPMKQAILASEQEGNFYTIKFCIQVLSK
jgi:hypothetical protein